MSAILQKIKKLYRKVLPMRTVLIKDEVYPKKDWDRLIAVSLGVVCVLFICAFYFYTQINAGTLFVARADSTQNAVSIKNTLLKQVVDDINLREKRLEEIKQNQGIPADPSK